jgi:hypothetical protein
MKTAVELFIEQLEAQGESWENVSIGRIQISIKVEDYLKLIQQAKEMEKERVIDFAKKFSDFNGLTFNEKEVSKEYLEKLYDEYYNETFKSE